MEGENSPNSALAPREYRSHDDPGQHSQLRQRPLGRSATFADGKMLLNRRRSSLFSENLSEARGSIRSSTSDLLLPRAPGRASLDHHQDHSHWSSVPLGLALLPALGGVFFHNGSAIVTDVTLLGLAAVFLNWSVRIPWDWYLSAQATTIVDPIAVPSFETITEEGSGDDGKDQAVASSNETSPEPQTPQTSFPKRHKKDSDVAAAEMELRLHELMALLSCFVCPAIGAWVLHGIRSQLSRPSEGLVSNYNLTVFLLAAEIRPVSHLVKMIQTRTLHLQRVVTSSLSDSDNKADREKLLDLAKRLEELEAHVADSTESSLNGLAGTPDQTTAVTTAQATSDIRKSFQPELDALNRAVRRYEKRTTISAVQTDSRLQELEFKLQDIVVLAAAAQRNADQQPRNFIIILANWICGAIVLPLQFAWYIMGLPSKLIRWFTDYISKLLSLKGSKVSRSSKSPKYGTSLRARDRKIRTEM